MPTGPWLVWWQLTWGIFKMNFRWFPLRLQLFHWSNQPFRGTPFTFQTFACGERRGAGTFERSTSGFCANAPLPSVAWKRSWKGCAVAACMLAEMRIAVSKRRRASTTPRFYRWFYSLHSLRVYLRTPCSLRVYLRTPCALRVYPRPPCSLRVSV